MTWPVCQALAVRGGTCAEHHQRRGAPAVVQVMSGIRVLEVASWTYVPVAGAILAEWGADVIKVEHPETGDPQRGLVTSGLVPLGGVAHMVELPNRGKRSIGLDMKSPE